MCAPCGIKFSSLSTLEAHQTYYCSHRPPTVPRGGGESESEDVKSVQGGEAGIREEVSGGESNSGEPPIKSARSGKQYKCPHCSYSADKKVSLNRHMRMHSTSPAGSLSGTADSSEGSPHSVDRYCQDCDIRFSSTKTFRAHKMHYCSTRHVMKPKPGSPPPSPVESQSTPPPMEGPPQHFLALPTNPILIIPYSLLQGASILSGAAAAGLPNTDTACLLLPDGTLQPLAQARPVPVRPTPEKVVRPAQPPSYSAAQVPKPMPEKPPKPPEPEGTSPLDLSCRREDDKDVPLDLCEDEKESRRSQASCSTPEHEDIICAPSIPLILSNSSVCSSPSPTPMYPTSVSTPSHSQSSKRPESKRRSADSHSNSPSPKSSRVSPSPQAKSPRRTPNGINVIKTPRSEERRSSMPDATPKFDSNINLQNLLLAAVQAQSQAHAESQVKPEFASIPYISEILPQLSAIYNARLAKGKSAQTVPGLIPGTANIPPIPLSFSQMGAVRPPSTGELINQAAILPLLSPELALRLAASSGAELPSPQPTPHVLVKQGDSKCQECNIVFYKHENYVAHKKHYCSARKLQDTPGGDDKESTSGVSPPPSISPKDSVSKSPVDVTPSPPVPSTSKPTMYQFICVACGIKFTSFDNLTAHQTYYCPKRSLPDTEKPRRCPKCKLPAGPDHHCSSLTGGWKCPCCPVTSPTASAAQKHMDTHSGVKAFLCTICRYKGNTLRGMRTHIRMHFDKRPADVNEEHYITCVIDDSVVAPPEVPPPPVEEEPPRKSPQPEKKSCNGEEIKVKEEEKVENIKQEQVDDDEYIEVEDVGIKTEPPSEKEVVCPKEEIEEAEQADDLSMNNNKDPGPRYCKQCDISFTYHSTFIAHKRYYCTNPEEGSGEAEGGRTSGTPVT